MCQLSDKYKNKYRIPSARAEFWDYSSCAAYFITICTAKRLHYFGEIENGQMKLSEIGLIAQAEWLKSAELRPDMNLFLGEYVIMPNHFHGIIAIGENWYNSIVPAPTVETQCIASLQSQSQPNEPKNKFGVQSKNLSSIIRGFKIGVTTNARKMDIDFAWQSRFHDRIIRNSDEYQRVANYINTNPEKWEEDMYNE